MMSFAEILNTLPFVSGLKALELLDSNGQVVAIIENRPGQAGSLAVYHALALQYDGTIAAEAAAKGLQWYAEHTEDARAHPGKHPNIDRLFACAAGNGKYAVRLVANPATPEPDPQAV